MYDHKQKLFTFNSLLGAQVIRQSETETMASRGRQNPSEGEAKENGLGPKPDWIVEQAQAQAGRVVQAVGNRKRVTRNHTGLVATERTDNLVTRLQFSLSLSLMYWPPRAFVIS